jgi:hypothetical protein
MKNPGLFLLLFFAVAGRLYPQGAPPMLTVDPGTPGPNHWENNFGWIVERVPGSTVSQAPQADINYGVGERIQLTYSGAYLQVRDTGEPDRWGMSKSEFGVKWRFYDGGEGGLQLSVFPQVEFDTPGSHSARRGLVEPHTFDVLPVEFEKELWGFDVVSEVGHIFKTNPADEDSWWGGLVVGHEIVKGWTLGAEIYVVTDPHIGKAERTVDIGLTVDLCEHLSLLMSIGRDVSNTLDEKASLISYLGVQWRQ